ncbi:hypothetical protein [Glaciimonas soli]|uniref:Uncharacterized protein n=1 Tax=Glaciimonas soli TaxID=2590999 RepID=A0A843YIA4_9BURK|nr:hypothetical protein [Glaciimonas soli]MQQ99074.1 hypothetical protein [Glaciimonas soli]
MSVNSGNENGGNNSFVKVVIACVAAFMFFSVWQFSSWFGIDMPTGGEIIIGWIVTTVLAGAILRFGNKYKQIRFKKTWPIILALFWLFFWPALNFWSSKAGPGSVMSHDSSLELTSLNTQWFSTWYTKLGGLVIIAAIWGFVKIFFSRKE